MFVLHDLHYALARAKAVAGGKEVVGYVEIAERTPRENFTTIFVPSDDCDPEKGRLVNIDPMTVEMFTGLHDAVTGQRIFEGDVIQYYSRCGRKLDSDCYEEFGDDFVAEVCMPLNLTKEGANKRLYLYVIDNGYPSTWCSEGFKNIAHLWESLEWRIVGRSDRMEFNTGFREPLKVLDVSRVKDCKKQAFSVAKGTNVWMAFGDKHQSELFGTYKRHEHLARHLVFALKENRFELDFSNWRKTTIERMERKWDEDIKHYCPDSPYAHDCE